MVDERGRGTPTSPRFFRTPADLRAWFERNHDQGGALWVGYYKKATGLPSVTWPESVDAALCFGWIDGLKRSVDERSYTLRFTPRRKRSHWSARNLGRMQALIAQGLVAEPGLAAYERRDRRDDKRASYERSETVALPDEYQRQLKANPAAWKYFRNARPSYRKQVTWWVVRAKREATRRRRLNLLVESCAEGDLIPPLRWTKKEAGR